MKKIIPAPASHISNLKTQIKKTILGKIAGTNSTVNPTEQTE
jgi:hypothetical protein